MLHRPLEGVDPMPRGRPMFDDEFTPKGATRVPAVATPPTPLPQPRFSPEADGVFDGGIGGGQQPPPTPRRLTLGGGEFCEADDVRTPCRASAPSASAEATRRPPQIARRRSGAEGSGSGGNPLRQSFMVMPASGGASSSSSLIPGGMEDPPQVAAVAAGSNEQRAAALPGRAASTAGSAAPASASDGHALAARLSVGLMGVSRQAGELSRFMDSADAARAPLATFELLLGRMQAAEEALSCVRGSLEGYGARENVCASLLRRADTAHALEEAQRQSQRTPELTMLSRNLCASVAAICRVGACSKASPELKTAAHTRFRGGGPCLHLDVATISKIAGAYLEEYGSSSADCCSACLHNQVAARARRRIARNNGQGTTDPGDA